MIFSAAQPNAAQTSNLLVNNKRRHTASVAVAARSHLLKKTLSTVLWILVGLTSIIITIQTMALQSKFHLDQRDFLSGFFFRRRKRFSASKVKKRKKRKHNRDLYFLRPSVHRVSNKIARAFAACVVVKDDNHWLSEWLAYHYFVLPLRHVIFIRDPLSRKSPQKVLERWKKRIDFEEVTDQDIFPTRIFRTWNRSGANLGLAHNMYVYLHRQRQMFFLSHCLRMLKHSNRNWVLLADPDEFVVPNHYLNRSMPPIDQPGSVFDTIQQLERHKNRRLKCLHVPRIQIASTDSDPDSIQGDLPKSLLNASHFLTTRWIYHNGEHVHGPVHSLGKFLGGKNIVNIRRLFAAEIPIQVDSVHNVIPRLCSPSAEESTRLNHTDNWLVINHYLGTYEQYTYRDDPRDAILHRTKRQNWWFKAGQPSTHRDNYTRLWLNGFLNQLGQEEALRLLHDVGVLEPPEN